MVVSALVLIGGLAWVVFGVFDLGWCWFIFDFSMVCLILLFGFVICWFWFTFAFCCLCCGGLLACGCGLVCLYLLAYGWGFAVCFWFVVWYVSGGLVLVVGLGVSVSWFNCFVVMSFDYGCLVVLSSCRSFAVGLLV